MSSHVPEESLFVLLVLPHSAALSDAQVTQSAQDLWIKSTRKLCDSSTY